jgi:hypothetical protein
LVPKSIPTMATTPLLPSIPTWVGPSRTPAEVQDAWGGAIESVAWWLNLWGDISVNEAIADAVRIRSAEAKVAADWCGCGVLMHLRVAKKASPNSALYSRRILDGGPTILAIGESPAEALFNSLSQDMLLELPSDGSVLDPDSSYYIWVSAETPNGAAVKFGDQNDTQNEVRNRFSEFALRKFSSQIEQNDILLRVVEKAKSSVQDNAQREKIESARQAVVAAGKQVAEINRELTQALKEAEAANKTMALITTLQGVLSIAQLGQLVISELNLPPDKFGPDTTFVSLTKVVGDAGASAEARRVQLSTTFMGSYSDFLRYWDGLKTEVSTGRPPPVIQQYLTNPPKP